MEKAMIFGNCLVSIKHEYKLKPNRETGKLEKNPKSTEVKVVNQAGQTAIGIARCSKKDNFCKEVGRKLALKRAISQLTLTKEERTKLWKDYQNRVKI